MRYLRQNILCLTAAFALCSVLVAVDETENADNTLKITEDQITMILRQTAMPELGEGRLARILTSYYIEGLGGADRWSQISSLKLSGTLKLESGDFDLNTYQKKPDLLKVTVRRTSSTLVLAYDGETAWQQLPKDGAKPELMGKAEARDFIHNAKFHNHLLYPFAFGKKIKYMDIVSVEGHVCHQVRVTLDSDYQFDYFIDSRSNFMVQVIANDLLDQTTQRSVFKDYVRAPDEQGMPVARKVESYENGGLVSTATIDEISVNAGIPSWMFEMRR